MKKIVVVGGGGGGIAFLHRKSILSCSGPQHSQNVFTCNYIKTHQRKLHVATIEENRALLKKQ